MEYTLKNGKLLTVRRAVADDAEALIALLNQADNETRFLLREPGEFQYTVEQEREIIEKMTGSSDAMWYVAICDGRLVGQCSAHRKGTRQRIRHRATVGFVTSAAYCDMGIGGKMMLECIRWCEEHDILQMELDVVANNERALRMYRSFGFEIVGQTPNAFRYGDGTFADEYTMMRPMH